MKGIRERGHPLRFGIVTPPMWRSWDELLDLWTRAERCGFDLAFNTDHFQSDWEGDAGPTLEAWTTVAAMAREVPRIQVGTYVNGITHRPVAVLAKQAVTVDHLSGGRLILGLGAAWNVPEHTAYGIPFPPVGDRVGLVEEALEALRRLETEPRTTLDGRYLQLRDAPFEPKPVHGHIPILIGSTRPRMLRAAARHADLVDFGDAGADEITRIGAELAADCAAAGRDPDAIAWTHETIAGPDPAAELEARVAALAPLGVSVFLVNIWPRRDPGLVDRAGRALDGLRRRWAAAT
ncbi:MAG TPA: LLM class flavin-dependent oxidoreductase [Candidatus Limnocylindrales bacterium]|nr:LLM class flavin-dependent oxidoreductase [Candidatus Limnocylindrales bacterium]